MTWKAMDPARACDLLEFWINAAWPLTRAEVGALAVAELGWTIGAEGTLSNPVDALSQPAVLTSVIPDGQLATLKFWVSDVVKDPGAEAVAFLDDQFALVVREGQRRWGKPKLLPGRHRSAQWDLSGGGRARASRLSSSVSVEFTTPSYAQVLRKLGE
ncbi:MAG: DUF6301 family protein [Microbacterium sp.]|uniref:DUF6301 family protein n=1 Tax=Microbacterium sp. TaxID=51671 RepID=UPI0039E5C2CA